MFDGLGLRPDEIAETITGIEGQIVPMIELMPGVQRFTTTKDSGSVGVLPSVSTLGRALDTGLPEGAAAREIDMESSKHDFEIKRFVGLSKLTDGDEEGMAGDGLDGASAVIRRAIAESVAKQDAALNTVLSSTSINTEQAVTNGVWTLDTSTPLRDLQLAHRKSNYGNVGVFGIKAVEALQLHPDVGPEYLNYAGGSLSAAQVMEVLMKFLGLDIIIIGGRAYNKAKPGLSIDIGYQFETTVWIGHSKSFVIVDKPTRNVSEQARVIEQEATKFRYTRRRSFGRAHQEMGSTITGAVS